MKKDFWRRVLSGLTTISLLVNSLLPYSVASIARAQESTDLAVQETVISSETPLSTESPTVTPPPDSTPAITGDPTPTPTSEATLIPTPEVTPTASPEATPSNLSPPSPTSTLEPSPEVTPSATPVVSPNPSTESTSINQEKSPLRIAGDLQKYSKKQANKDYVEGEVIVKFRKEKIDIKGLFGKARAYVFEKKFSLNKTDEIKTSNIQVFKSDKSTEELVKELKSDPTVEYAEPNYLRFPTTIITNDTYKDSLWGLDNTGQTINGVVGTNDADIDAPEAWNVSDGGGNIIVAIIDSGVAYNHPDLAVNMWDGSSCKDETGAPLGGCNHGYDFENNDQTPLPDSSSHGTHIAGIIAAAKNNSKGVIGVSPQAKIMALKYDFTVANEVKAIDFAIQNGAKIINASFTGAGFSTPEYEAINRFRTAGGIIVAAAGNESVNNESVHSYPSDYDLDNIISVTATDQNDDLASFSNYGTTSVDVAAPGTNIYSTTADSIILNETFENVTTLGIPNGWVGEGTNNNWGVIDETAWLGSTWGEVLYGDRYYPYDGAADTTITSPIFNLSSTGAVIDFYTICDTEYITNGWADYMQLEYSSDGVVFSPAIDPYTGEEFRWDEPTLDILSDEKPLDDTGSSYFHYENISIPGQYLTGNFKFRFRWVTNSVDNNYYGCLIDDVNITKFNDGSDEKYDYMQGTSMAAPHVAGLAALIWGYRLELTPAQVKDRILQTGDTLPNAADAAKILSGKRINAYNALQSLAAPIVTGLADDPTPTKSRTWNWDSDDPTAQFRYLIDQVESFVPTGEYSDVKTATQPDGDSVYYIHVQAKGANGIEGSVTTVSAILDNTASTIEITSPLTGSKVNGEVVVVFTDTEITNPQCSIDSSNWVSCTSGSTTLAEISGFNELPEEAFTLYVKDTDIAGNTGADEESEIIKDTTAPIGSINSPINDSYLNTHPSFTASASDDNGIAFVSFQYKPGSASVYTDLNIDASEPYGADWTDVSLTTDTTYDLQIIITDTVGNSTTVSGVSFTYDTTLPTGLIAISDNDVYTNTRNVTLSFSGVSSDVVQMKLGNGENGDYQSPVDYENPHNYTLPDNGDETYFVRVHFIDRAGNESSGIIKDDIILDSTPPVTTDSTDSQWHNTDVQISLNCDDGESSGCAVTYYTTDGSMPTTDSSSGNVVTLTTDGIYTLKYFSKDNIGNTESVKTATNNVKIDKTSPEDPNITSSHTVSSWSNDNTIDLSWDEPLDNISGIAGYSYLWDTVATTLPDTVSEGTDTSVNSPTLVDGSSHYFHLRTIDNAGNWTSTVHLGPFFIDTIAPEVTTYTLDNPTISPEVSSGIKDTATINLAFSESVDYIISIRNSANLIAKSWSNSSVDFLTEIWNGKDLFGAYVEDGVYTIEVEITDRAGNFIADSSKTIIVDNDPLTLNSIDDKNVDEETELTFAAVASNDEGGAITYSLIDAPEGALIDSFTGVFSWTPTEIQGPGSYTFSIKALSGDLEKSEEITITVNEVNVAPGITTSAPTTATEDTLYTYNPSFTDPDGPQVIWSETDSDTCSGTIDSTTGTYTFTPLGPVPLTSCVLSIEINDDGIPPLSAIETTTITIVPVNDAPTANDGTAETDEDNAVDISLTGSDPEGDTLNYSINTDPSHGSVSLLNNQATYTPNPGFNGSDTFTFTVNDGLLNSNVATITITITGINDAPVISSIEDQIVDEYFTLTITPAVTDVDSSTFTFALVNSPAVPNSSIDANTGVFTFIPDETQGGSIYYFTIEANDGNDINNTGTESFAVTVNEINNKPTALDDAVAMDEDSIALIPHSDLLTNDTDPDNVLGDFSITSVANPSPVGSTVIINDLNIEFTTPTDFNGIASFEYTMSDGYSTDVATVTVTVNPVNDAPVAQNDTASFDEDTILIIGKGTLLSNDTDVDEDTLVLSAVFNPVNGTVTIDGDNVVFIPDTNYNGPASFEYTVFDGTLTDTATVTLAVNSINDDPVLGSIGNKTIDELTEITFTATATDVDTGSVLIYSLTDEPAGATINSNTGEFSFTPTESQGPGNYTLSVNVTDGMSIDSETITITVNEVNIAPSASDINATATEDTEESITLNASDSDIPVQDLVYSKVSDPSHGSVTIIGDKATYTPSPDFYGADSFTYKANDGVADSNTATVFIIVTAVNDSPVANPDTATVNEDEILIIAKTDLLLNDTDVDDISLTITAVSNPINGIVSIDGGNVVFTPTANYFGPASFDYTISDGSLTSVSTVSITVNSINDSPVAIDGAATTSQEVPVLIDLSASDVDGDSLTYSIDTDVSNGTLSVISGNQVTYTPNTDYVGVDSFTFKASDGTADSNIATVNITVNLPPVISDEATNTPGETSITITWTTDHPSTSRVIYDTVSHTILDVAPNYGYANSTIEVDNSPKVTSHTVTINGLTAGTTYYYRVVSHGSPEIVSEENTFTTKKSSDGGVAGTSSTSSSPPVCSDQKPGSAPTLISIIPSGLNEVALIWTKAKDPVTYYLIAFGTKPGEMLYGNPFVGGKDTTSYTVKGLSSGARYYFRVRAGNNCMPGDFSNELSTKAYGEALNEIPEGFSPGVLGEEATTTEEVLGKEAVSPTPEISPVSKSQDGKGLLGSLSRRNTVFAGIGIILLAAGYYFFIRRKRE